MNTGLNYSREWLELCHGRVRVDFKKRLFPQRMVGHQTGFPENGPSTSLRKFNEHLDNALRGTQGGIGGVSVQSQGLHSMILVGPLQLSLFCDSTQTEGWRGSVISVLQLSQSLPGSAAGMSCSSWGSATKV